MTGAGASALSFNEIVALATKAARGAGLGWGHAEDLGRAARWLAERGYGWDVALCRLLERPDASARAARLVALGDWAATAAPGDRSAFDDGSDTAWIVPLISAAIFGRPTGISVRGIGVALRLSPDGAMANDGAPPDLARMGGPLTIEATNARPVEEHGLRRRPGPVSLEALAVLSALADRTLVPASDASRAGAGAARTDND